MTKKKDLAQALQSQDESNLGQGNTASNAEKPSEPIATRTKARPANSRDGMLNIAGWFPANVKFELEELRLQRSRKAGRKITLQQIQAEAYNDLFKKYGRPELAPSSSK